MYNGIRIITFCIGAVLAKFHIQPLTKITPHISNTAPNNSIAQIYFIKKIFTYTVKKPPVEFFNSSFPNELFDTIFSYTLENILNKDDKTYESIFYVNKSFQNKVITYVHEKKLLPHLHELLTPAHDNKNHRINIFFPLYVMYYHPATINKASLCFEIKKMVKQIQECADFLQKDIVLTNTISRTIEGTLGNEDFRPTISTDPLEQKKALFKLCRTAINGLNDPYHLCKTKEQFLKTVHKQIEICINCYKRYKKDVKNTLLVEALAEQIVYKSCMYTLVGIQFLMLADIYHIRQKAADPERFKDLKDHTEKHRWNANPSDEERISDIIEYAKTHDLSCDNQTLNTLLTKTWNAHLNWLCNQYKLDKDDPLIGHLQKIVKDMQEYTGGYSIENYRYGFYHSMTNRYLITTALRNHLIDNFLDMSICSDTINIELFFEFLALNATCDGLAINERPVYKGFFLGSNTLTPALLNNILQTSTYVKEIIVHDIQEEIATQDVITKDTQKKRAALLKAELFGPEHAGQFKIMVQNRQKGDDHVYQNNAYQIVCMPSIHNRIEHLISMNVRPSLKELLLSMRYSPLNDDCFLSQLLFLEKHIFFLNGVFFKKIGDWLDKKYGYYHQEYKDFLYDFQRKIGSYILFTNLNNKELFYTFFSKHLNMLDKWSNELNEHQQSFLDNKKTFLEANDMLAGVVSKNNLENSKNLFLLLKQRYFDYEEKSKIIKESYIEWAQQNITHYKLVSNNYRLDNKNKFWVILMEITRLLKANLSYIVSQHKDVLDEAILQNIKIHLNKNKYLLVDLVEMNDLKNKITNSLPILYKNWGVSLGILDSNYKIIEPCFKEDTWYSVLNSIQDSVSDNMNFTFLHIFYSNNTPSLETHKSHNQYRSKIRQKYNTLEEVKETYNKWKTEIVLPALIDPVNSISTKILNI